MRYMSFLTYSGFQAKLDASCLDDVHVRAVGYLDQGWMRRSLRNAVNFKKVDKILENIEVEEHIRQ